MQNWMKKYGTVLMSLFVLVGFGSAGTTTYTPEITVGNNAPTIDSVSDPTTVTLVEGGTTQVSVTVLVSDPDGASDITLVNSSASAIGETNREDASCTDEGDVSSTQANFTCTFTHFYYDGGVSADSWTILALAQDASSGQDTDNTRTYEVTDLSAYNITQVPTWATLTAGTNNNAASNHLIINNTGNNDYTQFNVTAYDLLNGANTIPVSGFDLDDDVAFGSAQAMVNATAVTVTGTFSFMTAGASAFDTVYHRADVPAGLSAGLYTASSAWTTTLT